jgi:hypothetical protein
VHHHRDRRGLNANAAGDSVRSMKPSLACFVMLLLLVAAACGETVGPDGGPILPVPDSSTCVRSDGACVLCDDGMWHCDLQVISACSASQQADSPCSDPTEVCLDCPGSGQELGCLGSLGQMRLEGTGTLSCQ